jgi:protein-tyrosine-phosphatase/DNA-binding transcriptional ArsR family regulator
METDDAAFAFAALGQATRLDLLRVLLDAGPSGVAAGELAHRLGVPSSTLSFHLRALDQAGLIAATRQGRSLVYAVQFARLRALLAFLVEACCGGEPDRCGDLGRMLDTITRDKSNMSQPAFNVLFLCTHNSARSIMAEAILDRIGRPRFEGWSAGSDPRPDGPLPEVLALLKTLGHDIADLRSKSWNELTGPDAPRMDFVITLCDTLQGQTCPDFGATTITGAWPLPDPSKFNGSAAERATLLNEVYAGLRRRLEAFISLPVASLDRIALKARVDELADPHAVVR